MDWNEINSIFDRASPGWAKPEAQAPCRGCARAADENLRLRGQIAEIAEKLDGNIAKLAAVAEAARAGAKP